MSVARPLRIAFAASNRDAARFADDPAFTYRCDNLAAALRALGHQTWLGHVSTLPWREHWDVVVFHRPRWGWRLRLLLAHLRRRGVHAVADADDLVFDPALARYSPGVLNALVPLKDTARQFESHRRALAAFRQITVSTEPLAAHARRLFTAAAVAVVPNAVHRSWHAMEPAPAPVAEPLISYLPGTRSHDRDFALVAPALGRVLARHPRARLRVTGTLAFRLDARAGQVEHHPKLPFGRFHEHLRGARVNLAPLEDTPFTRCKSAIKVMEAAWWNVPTVCTPIPDVLRFADAGACPAADADAFEAALERLLSDEAHHRAVSEGLRERVRPLADIDRVALDWLAMVQPFVAARATADA